MEIPKQAKISFFFKPHFLNFVLLYFLGLKNDITIIDETNNFPHLLKSLKLSPLQKFLDIISLEFNKHDSMKTDREDPDVINDATLTNLSIQNENQNHCQNHCQNESVVDDGSENVNDNDAKSVIKTLIVPNDSSPSEGDSYIYQSNIINKFLEKIDIEVLNCWACDVSEVDISDARRIHNNEIFSFNNETNNHKSFIDKFNKQCGNMLFKKPIGNYVDKLSRGKNELIFQNLNDLEFNDFNLIINQLYLYMSIILCVGVLCNRGAWGIIQLRYLKKNEDKKILAKWDRLENNDLNILQLSSYYEGNMVALDSGVLNDVMGDGGWMNVSSELNNYTSTFEDFKTKLLNLEKDKISLNDENLILNNKNEELLTRNQELVRIINECNGENNKIDNEINIEKVRNEIKNLYENQINDINNKYQEIIGKYDEIKDRYNNNLNDYKNLKKYHNIEIQEMKNEIEIERSKNEVERAKIMMKPCEKCEEMLNIIDEDKEQSDMQENQGGEEEEVGIKHIKQRQENINLIKEMILKVIKEQGEIKREYIAKNKELVDTKEKYIRLKEFSKKLRKNNLKLIEKIEENNEVDKHIWEWVIKLRGRIRRVDEQMRNICIEMDSIIEGREDESLPKDKLIELVKYMQCVIVKMEGYMWGGRFGDEDTGIYEYESVESSSNVSTCNSNWMQV